MESLFLEGSDDYIKGIYYYHLEESSVDEISNEFKVHLELASNLASSIQN